IESDEVQDLICEYYNSQNEKYTRLNAIDEEYQDEYQAYSKEQEQQAAENQEKAVKVHSTTRSNSSNRRKERTKVPSLRFKDVQDALTSSDIERIFKDYASSIRGSLGTIKRSGSEISMGSLSMNLSKGTWIRHSSGKKGNIFGFVAEGACVSKRQSLEIVAELSGIRAESSSYDYRAHVASSRANKEKMQEQTQQKQANEWIVAQDKINNADIFDPYKHLKGMMQHNILEAVYAYKDANDKLLGHVVRFVSKENGKKQTLPVTYCYNAAKDEQAWRLKGFTDKGDKPIFGIEKAALSSKPILIVEGEKVAIAAAKILPDYSVVSWMGGSNAADKVNWNQLQWRDVIIWPDNDKAGFKAAEVIKDKINKANDHIGFVSVVDPTTLKFNGGVHKDLLPEKWDLADRLPEGMTTSNVKEAIENVRAAHLDLNQIQSVLQSTNASDASQQLVERNIWQEVFKGKIVGGEQITNLAANEYKAATFFRSEEASNYVKYLEATGKGGVAHDYLKYDSPMYQDLLTSLATRDERLSENIKSLGNSNNTADISTDTVTIEAKTKLIDDAQSLYEKKALDYGGIAGTHAVYRDHLELMVKNYGESHGKVTLYKDIVRDVSILHSAQLSMNIHDLPDSHHKEIAGAIYNNVNSYKASSGRGKSEHNIDNHDKAKIATNCYEQFCGCKVWSERTRAHLNESLAILERRAELQRDIENDNVASKLEREKFKLHQEQIKHEILVSNTVSDVFAALEKDQKFFVALNGNIKYEIFNSQFQELAEQALKHQEKQIIPKLKDVVAAVERNKVFATSDILAALKGNKDLEETYQNFDSSLERHQLETQHQQIRQDKVNAKTTDEMLNAITREHEFFKSLDGNIQYRQTNDQYINYSQQAIEHEESALLPKLKDVVAVVEQHEVLSTQDILEELKSSKDLAATYKRFDSNFERHQLETQHQVIQQEKENANTTDEMLTVISREHEFFKSLDGNLKYAEKYNNSILSAISNAKTIEQDTLITNMHNMVVYAKKHGILNDQEILNKFNSSDSQNVLNNLSKTCQQHYIDHHNENIKQLLEDEHVMVGTKKYTCPLKYMKHEMQNNIPDFIDEKQIAKTFTKVKAEVKEMTLEHTMTMSL
ncbi:toprim domain-containing protein, partial [Rickettsia endosymbiont of Ixodes scapularis]|uniref:toprim domain-containing protein n=1 Tax=Rickettsia endosymbiont of Ixodes scapularis TaxID=444612 RepID=UPI001F520C18